ncbi:fatty acid hydroxylase superfamily-domain-containing protein [Gilbertella persicaria]|uniref:fatty acid hydroxylase superfamily-domain-containing protein n=1 Tax=Gilbertella persicaria TaxID=101096 RepID=UPI00221F1BA9|nr:fatty acid hydroxylase superfamily-domain-containing protein [Gilbertella persicaria]KAI8077291.1 fatty acid hydroxylase superfamily-domain-containing protein [Gilbertella persicaria]
MNTTNFSKSTSFFSINSCFLDIWSDEMLAIWVPIAVYWIQCSFFELLMQLKIPFLNNIHELALKQYTAVMSSILDQFGYKQEQTLSMAYQLATVIQNYIVPCAQFFIAMFIVDTHQYALHRLAHTSAFLYKHMHSHHHRLYAPYAFGALYNHPVEGFLLDTCGAALAFELTGMSPRLGMYFFAFSTLKTINDHCGYSFPWDPLTVCFRNNVNYHNIHHQAYGIKTNFSQPFFTFWDVLLHTEYSQVIKAKAAKMKS